MGTYFFDQYQGPGAGYRTQEQLRSMAEALTPVHEAKRARRAERAAAEAAQIAAAGAVATSPLISGAELGVPTPDQLQPAELVVPPAVGAALIEAPQL